LSFWDEVVSASLIENALTAATAMFSAPWISSDLIFLTVSSKVMRWGGLFYYKCFVEWVLFCVCEAVFEVCIDCVEWFAFFDLVVEAFVEVDAGFLVFWCAC